MAESYRRLQDLIRERLASEHIADTLDAILQDLVERVEADPELSHQVISDSLRSSIMSSYWLHS